MDNYYCFHYNTYIASCVSKFLWYGMYCINSYHIDQAYYKFAGSQHMFMTLAK